MQSISRRVSAFGATAPAICRMTLAPSRPRWHIQHHATAQIPMQLTPLIAIQISAAIGALLLGPVALWARKGARQHPRLHRAFGYAWVTLILATALSAIFIRDYSLPNVAGYTPSHLLVPVTLVSLFGAFWFLSRGNIYGHRKTMQKLYVGACIVAGAYTLLPGRYLGNLVFGQWLGLV